MAKINFKQAKEFLENINENDKVAIIHHDDLDGFASGILLADWCKKKDAEYEHFVYNLGQSKLSDYNLEKFNKILIADLAPNFIIPELNKYSQQEIFYTDHHQEVEGLSSQKNVVEYRTPSKISSSNTCYQLIEENELIGTIGVIADAGWKYEENMEKINAYLKKEKISIEEFKKIVSEISYFIKLNSKDPKRIIEEISKIHSIKDSEKIRGEVKPIKEEIQKLTEEFKRKSEKMGPINFFYCEPKLCGKSLLINEISYANPEEVYIITSPIKEKPNKLSASGRCQNKTFNMVEVLNAGVNKLEEGQAGGHIPAAGCSFLKKDLPKFKENLKKYVENKVE